jgi:hypothetical protein
VITVTTKYTSQANTTITRDPDAPEEHVHTYTIEVDARNNVNQSSLARAIHSFKNDLKAERELNFTLTKSEVTPSNDNAEDVRQCFTQATIELIRAGHEEVVIKPQPTSPRPRPY